MVFIFGLTSQKPPVATHTATRLGDVRQVLQAAEAAAAAGRWAVVMVAYDAAPAFEPAMTVRRGRDRFPLAWAAEYDELQPDQRRPLKPVPTQLFEPLVPATTFCEQVRKVQNHIAAGDTYQVNLTFPMECQAPADLHAWFDRLQDAQQARYPACFNLEGFDVLCLSPELFFEIDGSTIRTRPMKGTIQRGRWQQEDEAFARALVTSPKAQAENVMIVDLLRNDTGRIAAAGTVKVRSLFDVERYPTLWQMTSTVEGTLPARVPLTEIFSALFPCGSVTGAPKISTVRIISDTEEAPRGLYTGTVGLLRPDGNVTFNVAIRTIVIDRSTGIARMGVGAGITADSVPEDEYEECLLKGAFASAAATEQSRFDLFETMRLEAGSPVRLERHLQRLGASARYFGFRWDEAAIRASINKTIALHREGTWRLRVSLDRFGHATAAATAHEDTNRPWQVAFSSVAVDERDPFLFNKTTRRDVYDTARRARPDVDDVLLCNSRGELTESTIANVVVEIDGERHTPPVDCGLLAGTLRAELLDAGDIRERVITRGEVMRAPRIWLINSLRGWLDATLVR